MPKDNTSDEYLNIKTELRSLLISSQQGCTEYQLIKDFASYNAGKEIPFRAMGYKNLMEFLASMPDVARLDNRSMPPVIFGVPNEHTKHIHDMVSKQKRKRPVNKRYQGPTIRNRTGPRPAYYQTPIPFQPYAQLNRPTYGNYFVPAGPIFVNHLMAPSTTYGARTPAVNSIASFPPKGSPTLTPAMVTSNGQPNQLSPTPPDENSSSLDDDFRSIEDEQLLNAFDAEQAKQHGEKIILVRKRIRNLLVKCASGLWLYNVEKLYKKSFDEELNLEEFQFKNLMGLFDCVSDFVDSRRDPQADSPGRLLILKPNFVEIVKRESLTTEIGSTENDPQNSTIVSHDDLPRLEINSSHRPLIDLSAFVSLDFHYKRFDYTSSSPFAAFLGDVEHPWDLSIGNKEFISTRERMMIQMQDHYNQSSNQPIYIIPFEQLEVNLSCVYQHTDRKYYRVFIAEIDRSEQAEMIQLKVFFVDYGICQSGISHTPNSTQLKFLHKEFSSLSTQVYDCRLANIDMPRGTSQWSSKARQLIINQCQTKDLTVTLAGYFGSLYCIYLWLDDQQKQSINDLLIENGLAERFDDRLYEEFKSIQPAGSSTTRISKSTETSRYLDEPNLFTYDATNSIAFEIEEKNLKHFYISIEHAYYFVKHPYTHRPCLPCFELARLLQIDESQISSLNLVRETKLLNDESNQELFHDLHQLSESNKCQHLNRLDTNVCLYIYDLRAIRDYLLKIKYQDGDVLDAFLQEYENCHRSGYWNEKNNRYICGTTLQSQEANLLHRRDLLNIRKEQILSSLLNFDSSQVTEIHELDETLSRTAEELQSIENVLRPNQPMRKFKSPHDRMRETRLRIARPFDQQFGLSVCFDHRIISSDMNKSIDEFEELFADLFRIAHNYLQFFHLESEVLHQDDRSFLHQLDLHLPKLKENIQLHQRIEIYNFSLEVLQALQPIIRSYVQRTDMIEIL